MPATDHIQRVRIYLSERDRLKDQVLYVAVLDQLRRAGATGATVLRGVAGFGSSLRLHMGAADATAALPIIIEWIDRAERVQRVLPLLDELLADALITLEDVAVYRATLRSEGPFAGRTVGEATDRAVLVAQPGNSVATACRELLNRTQHVLPVLDANQRMLGMIAADALLHSTADTRSGAMRFELLRAMPAAVQAAVLATLPATPLADVIDREAHTLAPETPVAQAVGRMVEWGLSTLPVISRDDRFVGLFGTEQVLRAALPHQEASSAIRPAEPPTLVRLLMQMVVPAVAVNAPAAEALARLFAAPDHFVVLLDNGRATGMLADQFFVAHAEAPVRDAWIAALEQPLAQVQSIFTPLLAGQYAIDLPHEPAATIAARATRDEAIHMLLEQQRTHLIVVEEDGRMAGVLGRRGVLRALAQESAG